MNPSTNTSRDSCYSIRTFEECNQMLYESSEIDLMQYIDLTSSIVHDFSVGCTAGDSDLITSLIVLLAGAPRGDFDTCDFYVSSLIRIGIDSSEFKSKLPQWLQNWSRSFDCQSRQELRLLKHYKLVEGRDYEMLYREVDNIGAELGYAVSRSALYRIVQREYGRRVLIAALDRMSLIIFHFNEYKKNYRSQYIESLLRTIAGLADDLRTAHGPNRAFRIDTSSPIFPRSPEDSDRGILEAISISSYDDFNDRVSGSFSEDSSMSNSRFEYAEELSTIHNRIESFVHRVDTRISDVHLKLLDITTKLNSLTDSILPTSAYPSPTRSVAHSSLTTRPPTTSKYDAFIASRQSLHLPAGRRHMKSEPLFHTCLGNELSL